MVLTLYKMDASPPARAVMMTIAALKIPDVKFVEINLLTGDHLKEDYVKLNPQHTIPMLTDDDYVVWDSHAIAVYLVSVYGADDSLYPKDPKKRAIVDQRLHFDSGILFPALRGAGERVVFFGEKAVRAEALTKIESAYEFTDKFLSSSTWMAGEQLTLADICCVSSISSLNEILRIDKDRYPNLWAWFQRCSELPLCKTLNQPGTEEFGAILKSKLEENNSVA